MEKGIIEVAPLAYMRGRTLDNSYIVLDEAQNTTGEQMKNVSDKAWLRLKGNYNRRYYPIGFAERKKERTCNHKKDT